MAKRTHEVLTATRLSPAERRTLEAAAALEGVTITELMRRIVLPAVGRRLVEAAADLTSAESTAA
jgi:uncharacterized protein (DUF1778 family)